MKQIYLQRIIKTVLNREKLENLTTNQLLTHVFKFLIDNNITKEEIIVKETKNEVLYLSDYSSLTTALWECIESNLVN